MRNSQASRKLVANNQVEDLDKASGLDYSQPQGALAVGQCGLGTEGSNLTGLAEGHSL